VPQNHSDHEAQTQATFGIGSAKRLQYAVQLLGECNGFLPAEKNFVASAEPHELLIFSPASAAKAIIRIRIRIRILHAARETLVSPASS